jgi:hypothetical protein
MLIVTLILAGLAGLSLVTALALLVISVQVTDQRRSLRNQPYGRIDALARRVLGVYTDRPSAGSHDTTSAHHYDNTGR